MKQLREQWRRDDSVPTLERGVQTDLKEATIFRRNTEALAQSCHRGSCARLVSCKQCQVVLSLAADLAARDPALAVAYGLADGGSTS